MIKYISEKEFIFPGGVLIPVTVRRTVREGTIITAFDNIIDGIKELGAEDGDAIFSEDFFGEITAVCESAGYMIEPMEDTHDHIFSRPGGGTYEGEAVRVAEDAYELENLTDLDLDEIFYADEKAFMIVRGGRIVSMAVENPITESPGTVEIAAFTAEGFRGRGFARECINALCADTDSDMIYLCDVENEASAAAARSCGFVQIGQVKYFVAYENQNEELS